MCIRDSHVTWCLAKTIYQTSRWDVAVTNGHCSRAVLPLTPPEITETCSVRTSSSLSQTFCAPNRPSPDLNTVGYLPSVVLFSRYSTIIKISIDKMKRAIVKSMATTEWRSHCQFTTFITFLLTVNVIRQMAPLFSKVDSNKLWHDVQKSEWIETVICVKIGKDLFNISKVIGCRTSCPPFFGLLGIQGGPKK